MAQLFSSNERTFVEECARAELRVAGRALPADEVLRLAARRAARDDGVPFFRECFDAPTVERRRRAAVLRAEIAQIEREIPTAMVLRDRAEPRTPRVLDRVARLDADLASGARRLGADGERPPLLDVLAALEVPASSQLAVFTRSSFQAKRISPRRPRAIYFSDDVYVGFVPGGDVLELTAVDPAEGLVFYTLDRTADAPRSRPRPHRRSSGGSLSGRRGRRARRARPCPATTQSSGRAFRPWS